MPKILVEIEYQFKPEAYRPEAVAPVIRTEEEAARLDAALVTDEGVAVFLAWMEEEGIEFKERGYA